MVDKRQHLMFIRTFHFVLAVTMTETLCNMFKFKFSNLYDIFVKVEAKAKEAGGCIGPSEANRIRYAIRNLYRMESDIVDG